MEIVSVSKEILPRIKLIGKRYTNQDRDESGTFSRYWQQCFQEGWPSILKKCKILPAVSDDLIGAMRITGGSGDFEYWIGAFFAPDAAVPDGFLSAEIPAGEIGVCRLRGNDKNGELYSAEASGQSMAALTGKGWRFSETGWFFERYNNPLFIVPDENGNVILDICAYLF